MNLGETSFLDARGGPGFMVEEIADVDRSGAVSNGAGQAMPGTSNSISGLSHIVWQSNFHLFRASYAVEALDAAVHVNAGAKGSADGWGDLTVSPLILQWNTFTAGDTKIDQRFVLDFDLPTGEYRRDAGISLSGHAVTVHPYYAITVQAWKHWETSWRVSYLWVATDHSPPIAPGVTSMRAGQAVHFNASVGYRLPRGFWVGANGYFLDQVSSPEVNGIRLVNSPERVGAIGPGVLWDRGRYAFYANGYHEAGAENRPEGNNLVLRMQWIFGKPIGTKQ